MFILFVLIYILPKNNKKLLYKFSPCVFLYISIKNFVVLFIYDFHENYSNHTKEKADDLKYSIQIESTK